MLLVKQDREYGSGRERRCENNDRYDQGVKAGSVRGAEGSRAMRTLEQTLTSCSPQHVR